MKKSLLLIALVFSLTVFAQRGYRDGNRIGISVGLTQTALMTSNFETKAETGWTTGFSVRGNYYNDWSMIFGMQLFKNQFSVATKSPLLKNEEVKYNSTGAQIRLLLSYNIVKDHVSLDFGPVLQVNDKLKFDSDFENNTISGTLLTANDIINVTKFNGNFYTGISAGNRRVRAIVCYQFGLNNFLNNLNKDDVLRSKNNNNDFKGHLGIVSGQLLFNL
ncbi:PorT family protein [Flavobacterium sp.]|uniref:PorT family protein n=1 Tax=Flavobacterium sp. TaxID=239 RepID=UPI0026355B02|nr:PorT family protein [Flavobacterium sp.]